MRLEWGTRAWTCYGLDFFLEYKEQAKGLKMLGDIVKSTFFKYHIDQGSANLFHKGQRVNILGFMGQEAKIKVIMQGYI